MTQRAQLHRQSADAMNLLWQHIEKLAMRILADEAKLAGARRSPRGPAETK